jgi:hypothetical protein
VPPLHIDTNAEYAKSQIDAVRDSLNGPDGLGGGADEVNRKLQELAGQHVAPKIDADTSDAEQAVTAVSDLLAPLDGKTIETRVRVLLDDETGGGDMSRFNPGGPGSLPAVHIPTVLDAPTEPPDIPTPDPVVVPIIYDTAAGADPLRSPSGIDGPFAAGGPSDITITVTADTSQAEAAIQTVQDAVLDPKTLELMGDATIALAAVDNVNGATVDPKTLSIFGDATVAFAAINNVNNTAVADKTMTIFGDATLALAAIANVNNTPVADKTMTINVVTAYSTTGTPPKATRHGGIPGYATGGVLFEAGEAGPEIAHFAGGGSAVLPSHAYYVAPQGTYIEPANSARGKLGGGPLVHIENITIGAGADPASAQAIVREIVTRLDRALEHRDRSGGLVA